MKNNIDLSIVLPSYQEEKNLQVLIPRLLQVISDLGVNAEVLVVDTQTAMDNTKQLCEQYGVRHLPRDTGNFLGCAVRTGIAKANGSHLLFMDADGSHPPEFIKELYFFANDFDVVIASRYVDKGDTENSLPLILMSRIVNLTFSIVLNLPCKDVSNSFKIYRTEQLREINLTCNNFDIVEEILFKLKQKNPKIKFKEVPFIFRKRMFGETKRNLLVFIMTYVFTIIKLRFKR